MPAARVRREYRWPWSAMGWLEILVRLEGVGHIRSSGADFRSRDRAPAMNWQRHLATGRGHEGARLGHIISPLFVDSILCSPGRTEGRMLSRLNFPSAQNKSRFGENNSRLKQKKFPITHTTGNVSAST